MARWGYASPGMRGLLAVTGLGRSGRVIRCPMGRSIVVPRGVRSLAVVHRCWYLSRVLVFWTVAPATLDVSGATLDVATATLDAAGSQRLVDTGYIATTGY